MFRKVSPPFRSCKAVAKLVCSSANSMIPIAAAIVLTSDVIATCENLKLSGGRTVPNNFNNRARRQNLSSNGGGTHTCTSRPNTDFHARNLRRLRPEYQTPRAIPVLSRHSHLTTSDCFARVDTDMTHVPHDCSGRQTGQPP